MKAFQLAVSTTGTKPAKFTFITLKAKIYKSRNDLILILSKVGLLTPDFFLAVYLMHQE